MGGEGGPGTDDDVDGLIGRARALALSAHGDQRYGAEPYRVHLEHVEEVVRRYPHSAAMRAAAWLHDAVEDTSLTLDEVTAAVGAEVADAEAFPLRLAVTRTLTVLPTSAATGV